MPLLILWHQNHGVYFYHKDGAGSIPLFIICANWRCYRSFLVSAAFQCASLSSLTYWVHWRVLASLHLVSKHHLLDLTDLASYSRIRAFVLILPDFDLTVFQLFYLIVVVSTHKAAFPRIAIIMLAATYGFQVCIDCRCRCISNFAWPGHHIRNQTRIHADWLDGDLHSVVNMVRLSVI
jgi:hypothetical protein